jgi:hypothetical protein
MSRKAQEAQITGFDVSERAGAAGYLREAYHGAPYATEFLVPEGFDPEAQQGIPDLPSRYGDGLQIGVPILAATLRARLPEAIDVAQARGRKIYRNADGDPSMVKALEAFVALAEKVEAEGRRVFVSVSY